MNISAFNRLNTNFPKLTIWLVPLRSILLLAEIFIVFSYKGINYSSAFLLAIPISVTIITNFLIARRSNQARAIELLLTFTIDIFLLWLILHNTGGASNPFSIFFFLYLVLASLLFTRLYAWIIGTLTILAFGALLTYSNNPHHMHSSNDFNDHLFGMWIAYVAIGIITLTSISYLSREIAYLLKSNEKYRQDKLRLQSLTSLATGAAHELGTPLNTIQLLTDLLEPNSTEVASIKAELIKCKNILSKLQSNSGQIKGEGPSSIVLKTFIYELHSSIPDSHEFVSLDIPSVETNFTSLPKTLSQALRNLIKNGIEASRSPIHLKAFTENDTLVFEIDDNGPGISAEIRKHLGEPFISTKGAGLGMGLGIFVSKMTAEALGGRLDFIDKPLGGTLVRMEIAKELKL